MASSDNPPPNGNGNGRGDGKHIEELLEVMDTETLAEGSPSFIKLAVCAEYIGDYHGENRGKYIQKYSHFHEIVFHQSPHFLISFKNQFFH